jgi:ethylmalonyl-CoA/methylmalonyl-CoA decarboxylase
MHDTVTRLARLPLISVCLVRGRAIGGGAELTLSTDFRVFAPSGKLNFVQARLGVLPGWAGGSKLVAFSFSSILLFFGLFYFMELVS